MQVRPEPLISDSSCPAVCMPWCTSVPFCSIHIEKLILGSWHCAVALHKPPSTGVSLPSEPPGCSRASQWVIQPSLSHGAATSGVWGPLGQGASSGRPHNISCSTQPGSLGLRQLFPSLLSSSSANALPLPRLPKQPRARSKASGAAGKLRKGLPAPCPASPGMAATKKPGGCVLSPDRAL